MKEDGSEQIDRNSNPCSLDQTKTLSFRFINLDAVLGSIKSFVNLGTTGSNLGAEAFWEHVAAKAEQWKKTCQISYSTMPWAFECELIGGGKPRARLNLIFQAFTCLGLFRAYLSKLKPAHSVCKLCKEDRESSLHARDCPAWASTRISLVASNASAEQVSI